MKTAIEILDDPTKATLFGKFYEKIILGWFQGENLFAPFYGKPRVYWKDVEPAKGNNEAALRLNDALSAKKDENKWCTPDGFLEKDVYIMSGKLRIGHYGLKVKNRLIN